MARKVKFPLNMGNGVEVRTIEQLRAHFNLSQVLKYYFDGKLIIWMENRNYNDIAAQIKSLETHDSGFIELLFQAIGVECEDSNTIKDHKKRIERINILKNVTTDKKLFEEVDIIAFNQNELDELISSAEKIYLCGKKFNFSVENSNKEVIGINNPNKPIINIITTYKDNNFDKNNILFSNIYLTAETQIRAKVNKSKMVEVDNEKISLSTIPNKKAANIKMIESEDSWQNKDRIYLYKESVFYVKEKDVIKININEDTWKSYYFLIKPKSGPELKDFNICLSTIYNNQLVLLCSGKISDHVQYLLQCFNLDTLERNTINWFEEKFNFDKIFAMDVFKKQLMLCVRQGYNVTYTSSSGIVNCECFFFNLDTLELLRTKVLPETNRYMRNKYNFTVNKANLYMEFDGEIISSKQNYKSIRIKNKNGYTYNEPKKVFKIIKDKIIMVSDIQYPTKKIDVVKNTSDNHNGVDLKKQEVNVYDIESGKLLTFFNIEEGNVNEVFSFNHTIVFLNNTTKKIYFYDDETYEKIEEIDLNSNDSYANPKLEVDQDNGRMAVVYKDYIDIYE